MILIGLCGGCESAGPGGGSHGPADAPATVRVERPFAGKHPIGVVCTTGMVAELAREIGGNHVRVTALMGPGVDPHLYKPSPNDVSRLDEADLILISGLHLEGKMADLIKRLGRRKPAFAVAEYVASSRLLDGDGGWHDPHVWFDVALWSEVAQVVGDVLVAFDPPHAEGYRERTKAYRSTLAELDAFVRTELANVPEEQRVLVTAHDAFRYFGRAYGVTVRGIQGISTDAEAGLREVNLLVDFLVERKIKAVFVETSVAERNVKAIVEGCQSRKHDVKIGGELYSDALGEPGSAGATYRDMVRHNVQTIVKALR